MEVDAHIATRRRLIGHAHRRGVFNGRRRPTGPLGYWMRTDADPGFWGLMARGLIGISGTAIFVLGTWKLGQWIALALPGLLAWLLAAVLVLIAFAVCVNLLDRLLSALFVNPRGRLYVFRGNRRRRQLAWADAAAVQGHALALFALENTEHFVAQTELEMDNSTMAKLAGGPLCSRVEGLTAPRPIWGCRAAQVSGHTRYR